MFKKLLQWFTKTSVYSFIVLKIIPYIRFSTYYSDIRGWQYFRGHNLLQPGDIVLCIDRKKLTSVIIPGEISHAGFCVDKDAEWEISEMTHDHYSKSNFFDFCKESDRVVIMRCRDFDENYIPKVIERCKSYEDAKYDVDFSLGVKDLYCSELVYMSDFEKRLDISLEDLAGLGTPYISPTGLLRAKNCDVVWDSDAEVRYPDTNETVEA